jgi:hypothetical protein
MRNPRNIDGIEYAELWVCAHGRSPILLVLVESIEFGVRTYIFLGTEGGGIITVTFGLLHLNYKTANHNMSFGSNDLY